MHTNDTHGHIEYVPKKVTAIKQVRQANPNALLLDAGDVFSGTLYFNEYKGQADLEFMNLLEYDAMTFGNHEFDLGTSELKGFVSAAKFPFVSANVNFSNDATLKNSFHDSISEAPVDGQIYNGIIKVVNGEKIGIFGLTTEETPSISSPGDGVQFEAYIAEATKAVQQFKALGVNKIIALSHLGYNNGTANDLALAKAVEGIDIIVGGHTHSLLEKPIVDSTGNEPTLIVQTGEYSNNLGVLDVQFDLFGKVIGYDGRLINIGEKSTLLDDTQAKQILDTKYKPAVDAKKAEVVGNTTGVLDGERANVRTRETNLGNLITDGMLAKAKEIDSETVIAVQNGGGIRASIDAGDITMAEVLTVMPFGNSLAIMKLTGSEIEAALEHSVSAFPAQLGGFLHVSGLRFHYDPSKPVGDRVTKVEVKENGTDYVLINPTKVYTVATNTFTAKGGDGFTMFATAFAEGRVSEPGNVDWEMFVEYLTENPQFNTDLEGRIIVSVSAASFSGTAETPKVHNSNVFVDVTGVTKLSNAVVKGNLYLSGSVELDNVTVEGETVFGDN
ncbi:5'-nucleotidase C-terminal domain-containing protein [Neobacillus sp. YIM B06451]|uniref:bifunctional metallophosphatase/5'-nucleotidase n=1 Tax=Neobacillus sp. YIM B06451 TaxID=3070994 RepID=UPI0029307358|nr:5'-nucleotidase C-terminal domain-containing protein [Neobacillus sp. YIM B06451]